MKNFIPRLVEFFSLSEEEYDDEELDQMTSPTRANPFDPSPRVDIKKIDPQKMQGAGIAQKPQHPVSKPKPTAGGFKNVPNKPTYKGSFVGQTVDMGGQYKNRSVGWTEKPGRMGQRVSGGVRSPDPMSTGPGKKRFGHVVTKTKNQVVWDGNDWVNPDEWEYNVRNKKS